MALCRQLSVRYWAVLLPDLSVIPSCYLESAMSSPRPLHLRRDRSSVVMPASPPRSQTSPTPASAAEPVGCHLLPDAESLELQLHNMCGHLNHFVRKMGRRGKGLGVRTMRFAKRGLAHSAVISLNGGKRSVSQIGSEMYRGRAVRINLAGFNERDKFRHIDVLYVLSASSRLSP